MSAPVSEAQTAALECGSGLEASADRRPFLTIASAAYNEEQNLPELYQRLCEVLEGIDVDWEWIVVDDHSTDGTFKVLRELAEQDCRLSVFRFSRNFGSHTAITCALNQARGDCAIVLAADLQDPPELITEFLDQWRGGAQVVWGARRSRIGEKISTIGFSRLYYFLMRHLAGMKNMPATGADSFLIDRCVINTFSQFKESNVSIFALITWMGFRQARISYDKQPRLHGRSGWSIQKKLKLVVDSITAFSYLPIRIMSWLGLLFALCGFCFAASVVVGRLLGYVVAGTGYAALMTVLLLGFGFLMTFLGVLGEYLWRTFDEVRGRPRYIIERTFNHNRADHDASS